MYVKIYICIQQGAAKGLAQLIGSSSSFLKAFVERTLEAAAIDIMAAAAGSSGPPD